VGVIDKLGLLKKNDPRKKFSPYPKHNEGSSLVMVGGRTGVTATVSPNTLKSNT